MEAIFYRGGVGCFGVVPRSAASSGLVEPWLVSLSNHGLMVEQTLKQVGGNSRHSGPRPGICGR